MPIHDWSRIPLGLFHHFHQDWSIEITRMLNRGRLPRGLSALVEQPAGPKEPDVLAIEERLQRKSGSEESGVLATMERPVTRIVRRTTKQIYATRANRIFIPANGWRRFRHGRCRGHDLPDRNECCWR